MNNICVVHMTPKTPGIEIVRKVEVEKPTNMEAFLTGFFLLILILCPILIAATILLELWSLYQTDPVGGVFVAMGLGIVFSFVLSFIFMKLATR